MRKRRTKAEKEQTLNQILKLKVEGKSDLAIRNELQLSQRMYEKYSVLLKDKFTNEMLAQREEHFAEAIKIAVEGMQKDRQVFQQVMHDPKSSHTAKVLAGKEDRDTTLLILRTFSEAGIWASGVKQRFAANANANVNADKVLPGNVLQ